MSASHSEQGVASVSQSQCPSDTVERGVAFVYDSLSKPDVASVTVSSAEGGMGSGKSGEYGVTSVSANTSGGGMASVPQ